MEINWAEIAKLVRHMAETGVGTEECLAERCLPLPIHFYSPVPDAKDLERRKVWEKKSRVHGLDFNTGAFLLYLQHLADQFGKECVWPQTNSGVETDFFFGNDCFSYYCASITHCMVRSARPRRVIEVGSGFSSRVINGALQRNQVEGTQPCQYSVIDPFVAPTVRALPTLTEVIALPVQETPEEHFTQLGASDILFIDSSHMVKIGSDVNFLILDILPQLAPGVLVHFHDIGIPYEYPKVYVTNSSARYFWNESYFLQAFLAHNTAYEILLGMAVLHNEHHEEVARAFPIQNNPHLSSSGSFWIRRR